MRTERRPAARPKESGFSMVEMLMAAFVLSIGILGLTLLQAMSLRVAAGGHNMGMAVQLAEKIMDQVELEGRLTYLNSNLTNQATPGSLNGLAYINQPSVTQYYGLDSASSDVGNAVLLNSKTGSMFTVQMTQTVVAGTGLSDVQVQVQFTDSINAITQAPVQRTVTLTRRILHG